MSMKSLPRTPVASTATTLTKTVMAKAFQNNSGRNDGYHHKRALTEMMAPPPTPTSHPTPSSSSYLDCQSLQSSLKRVRLSSSPGELRLQRDLRHMVSSGAWVPTNKDNNSTGGEVWMWRPPAPPVTVRQTSEPRHPHIELQQVESLRFRLTFTFREQSIVAWIQIPRHFPHKPPLISRIVYNQNNQQPSCGGNIQSILVHEAPPTRDTDENDQELGEGSGLESNHNNKSLHCANTVVYGNWSPVQRLGDLLEFVISVFERQHDDGSQHQHNSNNNNNNIIGSSINDVSLTYSSSSLSSNSSWSNSRRSSNSSITSSATACTSGNRTASSSIMFPGWIHQQGMMTDISMMTQASKADLSTFLAPNRFDHGYDRAIPPVTMDVDTAAAAHFNSDNYTNNNMVSPQQQQLSMMDL